MDISAFTSNGELGMLALGLVLGAALVVLFVHSLFYSGFVEDPITWVAVAIAASFLVARGAVAEAPAILGPWRLPHLRRG